MKLNFTKMHGIGNDYIYFDCMQKELDNPEEISQKLSDRHFGVGGDGIVMICSSSVADAKMRMFNADGSEGKMCGNAIRCVGKFLYEEKNIKKPVLKIETLSGIKILNLKIENDIVKFVTVDMGKEIFDSQKIPVKSNEKEVINSDFIILDKNYKINCVSMGNPHCVTFVDNLDFDIEKIGTMFEHNEIFPERVNTEFVVKNADGSLSMRVWERGSGETWACGTGACAVGAVAVKLGIKKLNEDILIHLKGGDLTIKITTNTVYMTGSATKVFKGEMEI